MKLPARLTGILNGRGHRGLLSSNKKTSQDDVKSIKVRDLTVDFETFRAVDGVSFTVEVGETLGVLGESGSGKTSIMLAILGLLGRGGRVVSGSCRYGNTELIGLSETGLESIRGAEIGFVFQEPFLALHPTMRIQDQVAEVIRAHKPTCRGSLKRNSFSALETVFAHDTPRIARAYPHQLSGGQQQRVLIAQALAGHPQFLFADELTASLDSCTQQEILELLQERRRNSNHGMLIVSHNPAVLATVADRILVIREGKVIENGPVREVFNDPQHAYTKQLLRFFAESENETQNRESRAAAGPDAKTATRAASHCAIWSGPTSQ